MKAIVFHSYKGGTGKTIIAINIAVNLARKGFRTLAIDADLKAPTFESIFEGLKPRYRFNELFEERSTINEDATNQELVDELQPADLPINSNIVPNLDLIFADSKPTFGKGLLSMDKIFHANALKKLIDTKKEFEKLGYEYLLLDTPPSLDLSSINALIIADAAVIVLRPSKYDISGTTFLLEKLYSMLGAVQRKDFLVLNQVVQGTPKKLIEKWKKHFKKKFKVETIGIIPCDCKIALAVLNGQTFIPDPNERFAKIMDQITNNLTKELKE